MTQDERREFIARVAEENAEIHYRTHVGQQPERMGSSLDTADVIFTQPTQADSRVLDGWAGGSDVKLADGTAARLEDAPNGDGSGSGSGERVRYASEYADDETGEWAALNIWLKKNLAYELGRVLQAVDDTDSQIFALSDEKIRALELKIAALEGCVKVLTRFVSGGDVKILDLPNWRRRES
jgi:hypothetical protein